MKDVTVIKSKLIHLAITIPISLSEPKLKIDLGAKLWKNMNRNMMQIRQVVRSYGLNNETSWWLRYYFGNHYRYKDNMKKKVSRKYFYIKKFWLPL